MSIENKNGQQSIDMETRNTQIGIKILLSVAAFTAFILVFIQLLVLDEPLRNSDMFSLLAGIIFLSLLFFMRKGVLVVASSASWSSKLKRLNQNCP